jgi:ectoine hydroxylase
MHQFKINAKAALTAMSGNAPDYGTWKRDDGMPEPRARRCDFPRRG